MKNFGQIKISIITSETCILSILTILYVKAGLNAKYQRIVQNIENDRNYYIFYQ